MLYVASSGIKLPNSPLREFFGPKAHKLIKQVKSATTKASYPKGLTCFVRIKMRHMQVLEITKILLVILAMTEIVVATVQIEEKFQMSSKRAYFSTIEADKKIYFVGGFEKNDFIASNAIDVFDLVTGNWSDLKINLPTARGRVSTTLIGDRIYMAGGHEYIITPYQYSTTDKNFTSVGFTSGPTVRRPIRLSLYNSILTVIGHYSVDFMNTTSKQWTHNAKLTAVMSNQLFNVTTIAHKNFVFVIGGIDSTTLIPSSSIWMINSTSAEPHEFKNILLSNPGSSFVGSWFEEDQGVVLVEFDGLYLVYDTFAQEWRQRTTTSRSVSFVAYQNSTLVFFADGFWEVNWSFMNEKWTPSSGISFAFTVSNQLVYGTETEMTVLTSNTSETQTINVGPAALSIPLNSSMHIIVNTTGAIFQYNANTKQLVPTFNLPNITPIQYFRDNFQIYIIVAKKDGTPGCITIDASTGIVIASRSLDWFPNLLIDNNFYTFTRGLIDVQTFTKSFSIQIFASPIWVQQDNDLFLMKGEDSSGNPNDFIMYSAIDVYNYKLNIWEPSIPFPYQAGYVVHTYVTSFVLDNSFNFVVGFTGYHLNTNGSWTAYGTQKTATMNHPTYAPIPIINNVAYRSNFGVAGVVMFQPSLSYRVVSVSGFTGSALQTLATKTKIVLPMKNSAVYTSVAIFDIASETWSGPIFETMDRVVSVVTYDDWILSFGDNMEYFSYMDATEQVWAKHPFNNSFVPASMFTTQSMFNQTTLVIAGGYHRLSGYYMDQVSIVTLALSTAKVTPLAENQPQSIVTAPQTSEDNSSTIIIAVIVPIGAVAIAGGLLAMFLIRRKSQRKKRSAKAITIGLEHQFGQWYVPFTDLQFGSKLGQGANGQVFKGKWKNTEVALKTSMTQASATIASELSLMINMRPHPNVVQLFGFSVHPETNSIILILEFCNGGALSSLLYDGSDPISPNTKLHWLKSICKGISHLHSNNLVHRDLAARNVLLSQGEPKLTDFGMTRLVDEEQQRGTTKSELGPIRWMAPESLKSKEYSTKSDVWSFGMLMYEVLAQLEPHVAEDPIEIGRRIRDEGLTPELPESIECFSDFSSLLRQCCVVDPNYRLTIEQVLEKLEQIPL